MGAHVPGALRALPVGHPAAQGGAHEPAHHHGVVRRARVDLPGGAPRVGAALRAGPVEPTLPVLLFCVVFGLSMDYEVLLLSRMQEEYDEHGDNARAVTEGLARSGRLITSAAAIMVSVFAAFSLASVIMVKAMGVGHGDRRDARRDRRAHAPRARRDAPLRRRELVAGREAKAGLRAGDARGATAGAAPASNESCAPSSGFAARIFASRITRRCATPWPRARSSRSSCSTRISSRRSARESSRTGCSFCSSRSTRSRRTSPTWARVSSSCTARAPRSCRDWRASGASIASWRTAGPSPSRASATAGSQAALPCPVRALRRRDAGRAGRRAHRRGRLLHGLHAASRARFARA